MAKSASEYHSQTSYSRHRMSGHYLDWESQPEVFKIYDGLEEVRTSPPASWPTTAQTDLFTQLGDASKTASFANLCLVTTLTHAVTATARHAGKDFFYRSVASAGALYPFELYMAVQGVEGLTDGLYHHSAGTLSLEKLRSGRIGNALDRILPSGVTSREICFFITSIYYRSSWKYRDRAYRYCLLDSGHLLENLTQALRMAGLAFDLRYDFNDSGANEYLCVDSNREVCLALCLAGNAILQESEDDNQAIGCPHGLEGASRVSPSDIDYPTIREFHSSTGLIKAVSAPDPMFDCLGLHAVESKSVGSAPKPTEILSYTEALFHRRSLRNLVCDKMTRDQFDLILNLMCQDADSSGHSVDNSLVVGFSAATVESLTPGFYTLDRRNRSINLVRKGDLINEMAHICLDQMWLANCAAHFLFLTDLGALEEQYGPRGYRYAMLNAGRLGQRLYVAATALRLGCCGIGAFYDNEAANLLGLGQDGRVLYVVGIGPVKKFRE